MRVYFCDICEYPDEEKNKIFLKSYNAYINCFGKKPDWEPFVSIYNSCLDCPKIIKTIKKIVEDVTPTSRSWEDYRDKYGDSPP